MIYLLISCFFHALLLYIAPFSIFFFYRFKVTSFKVTSISRNEATLIIAVFVHSGWVSEWAKEGVVGHSGKGSI